MIFFIFIISCLPCRFLILARIISARKKSCFVINTVINLAIVWHGFKEFRTAVQEITKSDYIILVNAFAKQ